MFLEFFIATDKVKKHINKIQKEQIVDFDFKFKKTRFSIGFDKDFKVYYKNWVKND